METEIPDQLNDAEKTMIALFANANGGQTIVRACLWRGDWYDVHERGEKLQVDKLDMDRTKLFNTREEARAAAGISHIPDPKGKKKVSLYAERFHMPRMMSTPTKLTFPKEAVFEFTDENFGDGIRITYYEDIEQPKPQTTSETMSKVEDAAKAIENAAVKLGGVGQASIVPEKPPTASLSDLLDRVHVVTPNGLQSEVARAKEATKNAASAFERQNIESFKTTIRDKIHRRLFEELSERFSTRAEIVFEEPPWYCVDEHDIPKPITGVGRSFPWNVKSNASFMEVIEEFKQAGWECRTTISFNPERRAEIGYNRIVLTINPSST